MTENDRIPRAIWPLPRICIWTTDDLRGSRLGLLVLDKYGPLPPQLPEPVSGYPGSRAAPFCPSGKQAKLDGHVRFVATIFPVQPWRRFLWGSVQASIFLVLLHTSKEWGSFSTSNVVQDPISLAHHLSAPTKERFESIEYAEIKSSSISHTQIKSISTTHTKTNSIYILTKTK